MSKAWVLLLLLAALTAACLRAGSAEGDPIPPSLVDLLKNSPISSVEDLKQLLQQEPDYIEEEEEVEEEHDILVNHTHGRYTRSLMEAQPALQAVCKVRTEVMEVTRAMLDRRNANFMLWPPCVEVQRCSGCCNTRTLQCVPTITSTRYLQVIKIQYINKNAHYEKAIIPVEDHAGCRCQAASASPRSPVTANANANPPPPQPQQPPSPPTSSSPHLPRTHHPAPPQKSHASKADLHRHDDLKRNQQGYRHHEEREWQTGRYTQLAHTQPQPHWTQPRTHHPAAPASATHALHTLTQAQPSLWSSGVRADQAANGGTQQPPPREGHGHGSGYDGSKEDGGAHTTPGTAEQRHLEHTQRQQQLYQQQQQQYEQQKQQQQQQQYQQQYQYRQHYSQQAYPQYNRGGAAVGDRELRTQYRLNGPQSDSASLPGGDPATRAPNHNNPQQRTTASPEPTNQRELSAGDGQKATEVKNQTRTETKVANHESGKEREEAGSANSGDMAAATELTNQKRDKDCETSGAECPLTDLERRQKLLEIVQREPHLHPHHPQHRPKPETTSHKSVVTTTVDPSRSSTRVLPFRPALPRRRRRHRSRISKAAIRAMIM